MFKILHIARVSVQDQFMQNVSDFLESIQSNIGNFLWNLMIVGVVILVSRFVLNLVSKITTKVIDKNATHQDVFKGRRINTLMTLLRSVARYGIYLMAFLIILSQFGMGKPLENLIVTAGIGSLAIGFGAQNLVKDVVTGFFIMFENQFSVGDFVKIDQEEGFVSAIAMRVTYLTSVKGMQIIIPNGTISRVMNYTRGNSLANITISTPYEGNTQEIIGIIKVAVAVYAEANEELLLETPTITGITAFANSSVDIGVVCKVHAMKNWEVERGLRLAIKEAFDAHHISIPYNHVVFVDGNDMKKDILQVSKEEVSTNHKETFADHVSSSEVNTETVTKDRGKNTSL